MSLSIEETLARAPGAIQDFEKKMASAPYEEKGVLFSEIFFLSAAVASLKPARIFESGRARGVSTFLLGVCFSESRIVSIEFDRNSPDVPIATANLRGLNNIECLFGDAQKMLPEMVKPGDIVFIDGPKHHRALRLAFRLLCRQRPAAVFIHDCFEGSCERDFLKSGIPGVFFSDDPRFVELCRHLDEKCWSLRKGLASDEFQVPYVSHGRPSSYGPAQFGGEGSHITRLIDTP
jgi:hypothetical protein